MNPAIVYPDGNPGEAVLVDLHSIVNGTHDGKPTQFALKAIIIKHLRAGEILETGGAIYPKPCQLGSFAKWRVADPRSRGIYPDASAALLKMPLGYKTSVEPGEDFKAARVAGGFNQWYFLTAWGWSLWQELHRISGNKDWPLERRWQEMKKLGFEGEFSTFRQICSRLKLSVTKSGPNM